MRLFRKKSINLLTGLVLLLTVLVIGTARASASGTFIPFVPADGRSVVFVVLFLSQGVSKH